VNVLASPRLRRFEFGDGGVALARLARLLCSMPSAKPSLSDL